MRKVRRPFLLRSALIPDSDRTASAGPLTTSGAAHQEEPSGLLVREDMTTPHHSSHGALEILRKQLVLEEFIPGEVQTDG